MFNSNMKKEALANLEKAQRTYEEKGRKANDAAKRLYDVRKEAVKLLEYAVEVFKNIDGISVSQMKSIADATYSIRFFTEAIRNEEKVRNSIDGSTDKYVGTTIAGATVGAAVAAFGPTAAMAFATTFGTAATGTAITTLSGAAATNAALAWLGGGALAAGGGGMAAGSAILALAGPVGLAIGGATAGVSAIFASRKNKKIAEDAKKMTSEIDRNIWKLSNVTSNINRTRAEIEDKKKELSVMLRSIGVSTTKEVDYEEIVQRIVLLCRLISKQFVV